MFFANYETHKKEQMSKKEREKESKRMLSLVGLEKRMHHKPKQLSGGQQQRVSIAYSYHQRTPILQKNVCEVT